MPANRHHQQVARRPQRPSFAWVWTRTRPRSAPQKKSPRFSACRKQPLHSACPNWFSACRRHAPNIRHPTTPLPKNRALVRRPGLLPSACPKTGAVPRGCPLQEIFKDAERRGPKRCPCTVGMPTIATIGHAYSSARTYALRIPTAKKSCEMILCPMHAQSSQLQTQARRRHYARGMPKRCPNSILRSGCRRHAERLAEIARQGHAVTMTDVPPLSVADAEVNRYAFGVPTTRRAPSSAHLPSCPSRDTMPTRCGQRIRDPTGSGRNRSIPNAARLL